MTPDAFLQTLKNASPAERERLRESVTDEMLRTWLADGRWKVRNNAVKIISECRIPGYEDILCSFITDRTPAKFIDRLLGGDYYQVGFIRRNSAAALGRIAKRTLAVTEALCIGMSDRYWEVRVAALRSMRSLFAPDVCPGGVPEDIMNDIGAATGDPVFEVAVEALHALGELAASDKVLSAIRPLYDHPNVLVKSAAVTALKRLHDRGIIADRKTVRRELSNIFIPGKYSHLT